MLVHPPHMRRNQPWCRRSGQQDPARPWPAQSYLLVTHGFRDLPRTRPPIARTVKPQVTPRLPSSRTYITISLMEFEMCVYKGDINRDPLHVCNTAAGCTGCMGTASDLHSYREPAYGPCTGCRQKPGLTCTDDVREAAIPRPLTGWSPRSRARHRCPARPWPAQPYVLVTRGFWGLPRTRPPMARTVKSQVTPRLPSSRTSAPIYTRGRPDVNRGPNSRTPPPPAALPECTGCTGTRPDLRVHHAHVYGPCTG